jgi:hypothetical protein
MNYVINLPGMNVKIFTVDPGKLILFFSILLFTGRLCSAQLSAYDGFESRKLSKIWSKTRLSEESIEFQSDIVRKGKQAVKITLKSNDTFEAGNAKSAPNERDELMQTGEYAPFEGLFYEYKFSMFLPADFPIVNTRLVIAQWKQFCPSGARCSDDSPVIAIRYVGGELYITLQTDYGVKKLYRLNDEIRSKWLDFRFRIRFSKLNDGKIEAFLNENQIINYNGVTSYSENRGYPVKNRYYFKMGLYRDIMPEQMIIYIDEFSMKELQN